MIFIILVCQGSFRPNVKQPCNPCHHCGAGHGYTHDSADKRLALTYPDGKIVHYVYDLASRLVRVTDWLSHTDGYVYDSAGQPVRPVGIVSQHLAVQHRQQLTDGKGTPMCPMPGTAMAFRASICYWQANRSSSLISL